jgi:predicted Zn-dependent peptidase
MTMPKVRPWQGFLTLLLLLVLSFPLTAQAEAIAPYLEKVINNITEFTLDNGLKFIILENHEAPVVSFVTYADVGGVDEPPGKTGVAHFLEHLAFKGTSTIGTKDIAAEKEVLERLDAVHAQLKASQDPSQAAQLQQQFEQLQAEANQYVIQNEFGQIVETQGGVSLNAATSADATVYFYSFPANKLELWMSLESERFLDPVFREFYKEQQVILEERRLRTDNNPVGRMVEAYLDKAFTVHPYKRPTIGYDEDIRNLTRDDVQKFFATYYPPSNLTIAIVGDVDPKQVKQLAQVYFGRYPARPKPPQVKIVEPKQRQPQELTLQLPSQPWYLEGYHRPALNSPDHAIYEVMATILSEGRSSRLYKSLVEESRLALVAQGFNGFPGDKYPNLLLFYAMSAPDVSLERLAAALHQEIEALKTQPVSPEELQRAKNQLKASLLRGLDSNLGMARALTEYEVKTGDWRNLFNQVEAIDAVSAADIQRVAQQTFTPENRTTGKILPLS